MLCTGCISNPFPRESTVVFRVTLAVVVINGLYNSYRIVTFEALPDRLEFGLELVHLSMMLWTLGVFLRKLRRRSKGAGSVLAGLVRADGRDARALRAFAWLILVMMLLPFRSMWVAVGPSPDWASTVNYVAFVVLLIAFVVIYINHATEPTTFLVKLVGLSLATILMVLGLAALVLYPKAEMRRASRTTRAAIASRPSPFVSTPTWATTWAWRSKAIRWSRWALPFRFTARRGRRCTSTPTGWSRWETPTFLRCFTAFTTMNCRKLRRTTGRLSRLLRGGAASITSERPTARRSPGTASVSATTSDPTTRTPSNWCCIATA